MDAGANDGVGALSDTDDWPPRLSLEQPKILELLTGERFYSSADAALREAILNAIDACTRRVATDDALVPDITVTFDAQAHTVSIEDNGDGMTKADLVSLFTKIGSSAADAGRGAGAGSQSAIGEFGIGIASYFLACERFEVHTASESESPVALELNRAMRDAQTRSKEVACVQRIRGTTVLLHCTDAKSYDQLRGRFDHWARDVVGLAAVENPGGKVIAQGGTRAVTHEIVVETPDWIERAHIGPPASAAVWGVLDGDAHLEILYRGVFVQDVVINGLWGIEGALHVDPKRFKPKLNREAFLAEGFEEEITRFLQAVHPQALLAALEAMRGAFAEKKPDNWTLNRWVSLWLAIPRDARYAEAAAAWDAEFRSRRVFKQLQPGDERSRDVSLNDIRDLAPPVVYVAPPALNRSDPITRSAAALLAGKGEAVIQGHLRDKGYLSHARVSSETTAELLNHFRQELPPLVQVASVAQSLLEQETSLGPMFSDRDDVIVVPLGADAEPIVVMGAVVWLNVSHPTGKAIIRSTCDRNEGALGMLAAVGTHYPAQVASVARALRAKGFAGERFGPIRRLYFRQVAE